jgi:hypothetical protein
MNSAADPDVYLSGGIMVVSEVASLLGCELICCEQNMDKLLTSACGSDLMSDALSFAKDGCVLLTGMVYQHVVRTAEVIDIPCIVFVRGKKPTPDVIELAEKCGITLMTCKFTLYEACGMLYKEGLPACGRL